MEESNKVKTVGIEIPVMDLAWFMVKGQRIIFLQILLMSFKRWLCLGQRIQVLSPYIMFMRRLSNVSV